jgi:hypothetical protein
MKEAPGVERIAGAAAEKGSEGRHVGIARDHLRKLALQAFHLFRRDVLRRFRQALDEAGILRGKEAFRDRHEQEGGRRHGGQEHRERERLVAQHHVEAAPIDADQRLETPFDAAIEAAMVLPLLAQEPRAEHRAESERDYDRDRDGRRYGEGEFAKQTPDDAAHQQERYEHRDQRDADRKHRETDLTRALERGRHRGVARLDVPVDVLHHHDRVIDHEADGERQRHEREVVQAEAEEIHHRGSPEQRQRHGDAGNERGPQIAQKEQDHHHDQADGQARVNSTSRTEARMVWVRSTIVSRCMPGGMTAESTGMAALI